ncbi:MAG: hypothetical protein ACYC7F_00840 [Gemmatimonadaceae bacterium]
MDSVGSPSLALIRDLNLTISELPGTFADYTGSAALDQIRSIIGHENRRDALHLDTALKSECRAFLTVDSDILDHRDELEALLAVRIFHPTYDFDLFEAYVTRESA